MNSTLLGHVNFWQMSWEVFKVAFQFAWVLLIEFWYLWLILILLAVLSNFLKSRFHPSKYSYEKKQYFFTPSERVFYELLREIAAELNLELFAKVRLADVIYSKKHTRNWIFEWNKIRAKHIDFLLCDKANYTPVVAIELNGSSHEREDRIESDDFKKEALGIAGLKLVTFKVQQSYVKEEIKLKIKNT
jgi:hypothetical protein